MRNKRVAVLGNQIAGGIAAAAIGAGLCRISLGLWLLLNLAFGE